jgi:hypothetical protein
LFEKKRKTFSGHRLPTAPDIVRRNCIIRFSFSFYSNPRSNIIYGSYLHIAPEEGKKYEELALSPSTQSLIPSALLAVVVRIPCKTSRKRRWKLCEVITHPKHGNKQKKNERETNKLRKKRNVFRTKMSAGAQQPKNGNLSKWKLDEEKCGGWKINCQRCYT